MSQVIYTPSSVRDLDRIREFLKSKDPRAAARAGKTIISSMREVAKVPSIGKPIEQMPQEFRDWIIDFGQTGYILYALLYPVFLGTLCAGIGYMIFRRTDLP